MSGFKKKRTNKQLYNYYKKRERHWFEAYLDCHNRKFELIRTIGSFFGFILQLIVLLKLFGKI